MGDKGRGRPQGRTYTAKERAEVVAMCRLGDRSVLEIALEFGLDPATVHDWVKDADRQPHSDAAGRSTPALSEREELLRLRKEARALRQEVDILRRATEFFAPKTNRDTSPH